MFVFYPQIIGMIMFDPFPNMFLESTKDVNYILERMDIDWDSEDFTKEDVLKGFKVEQEHSETVDGDVETMLKIAIDHLREFKNYYDELAKMEDKLKESVRNARNKING